MTRTLKTLITCLALSLGGALLLGAAQAQTVTEISETAVPADWQAKDLP